MVEWKDHDQVARAIGQFTESTPGPVQVSIFGVEQPSRRIEIVDETTKTPPSAAAGGTLEKAQIRAEVRRHDAEIHRCYQGALEDAPGMGTRVSAWFLIGRDGKVSEASATGAPKSPALAFCILSRVRQMTFPSPAGGPVAVTYPWTFVPPKK